MKAYLLAAGFGSRLRPITDTIPKCLVEVGGHPMLDWWAKLLKEAGVTEVLVNTHYLRDQVHTYIESFNKENQGISFVEFYEEELLGSGGTVRANQAFTSKEDDFLICYADNLCNVNLHKLIEFHRQKQGILTMALFRTNHPEQCGIAELDEQDRIIDFVEKPQQPKCNLANAGIYVANQQIFEYFPQEEFSDFGKDVLPKLVGKMYGWETEDYLIDIGTMDNYEKAKREWNYDYYKDTLTD
ncbi:MAG: nucleotidyltransferase family protein [Clostridiales bacterium]|nr:nucleotidyltransferase family protein [Clostridiales bacterium]